MILVKAIGTGLPITDGSIEFVVKFPIMTTQRIGQRRGISAIDYCTVALWIPTTNTFSF